MWVSSSNHISNGDPSSKKGLVSEQGACDFCCSLWTPVPLPLLPSTLTSPLFSEESLSNWGHAGAATLSSGQNVVRCGQSLSNASILQENSRDVLEEEPQWRKALEGETPHKQAYSYCLSLQLWGMSFLQPPHIKTKRSTQMSECLGTRNKALNHFVKNSGRKSLNVERKEILRPGLDILKYGEGALG